MLIALNIRNLALVEQAELRLGRGLNVISGQTGGGKSLVVTALELLRGERANGALVRRGAEELQVDGEFLLGTGERSQAVAALVQELCGATIEEGLLLVTRLVDAHGRSRVRIGGRPSTLQALRQLGAQLLEIHGQGDSRALMRPETQCETLDAFAGTGGLRGEFAAALAAARAVQARITELQQGQRERQQRHEFLRFQLETMASLQLAEGEVAALEAEHQVLANLDALRLDLDGSLAALQESEASAAEQVSYAMRHLQAAAAIDPRLEESAELLAQAEELVAEVCRRVQSARGGLDLDPERLGEVQQRLDAIHEALRRHGPTETEFRANLSRVTEELARFEGAGSDPEALAGELRQRTAEAAALARKLVRARRKASEPFAHAIQRELADLGMAHTVVRVAMEDTFRESELLATATTHGPSPVDLEVRINPGEPFHSMRLTASGGELARIVLAVKKTMADQDRVPLMVLDEIDSEIGGRLGLQVGQKLADVARHHQVVIVTHLPQVAAFGQHHFLVGKVVEGKGKSERTHSRVRHLQGAEVEQELAAMSAGEGADAVALAHARTLVAKARAVEAASA